MRSLVGDLTDINTPIWPDKPAWAAQALTVELPLKFSSVGEAQTGRAADASINKRARQLLAARPSHDR
jgi:hypothetical protein